ALPISSLIKTNAVKGGKTTGAASPVAFTIIPTNIIMGTIIFLGALLTIIIINLSKYPVFSATPIPSITASTRPNAGNSEKFVIDSLNILEKPSLEIRFVTSTVFPVPGFSTFILNKDTNQDSTINPTHKRKNNILGSGNRFPAFSMKFKNLLIIETFLFV